MKKKTSKKISSFSFKNSEHCLKFYCLKIDVWFLETKKFFAVTLKKKKKKSSVQKQKLRLAPKFHFCYRSSSTDQYMTLYSWNSINLVDILFFLHVFSISSGSLQFPSRVYPVYRTSSPPYPFHPSFRPKLFLVVEKFRFEIFRKTVFRHLSRIMHYSAIFITFQLVLVLYSNWIE